MATVGKGERGVKARVTKKRESKTSIAVSHQSLHLVSGPDNTDALRRSVRSLPDGVFLGVAGGNQQVKRFHFDYHHTASQFLFSPPGPLDTSQETCPSGKYHRRWWAIIEPIETGLVALSNVTECDQLLVEEAQPRAEGIGVGWELVVCTIVSTILRSRCSESARTVLDELHEHNVNGDLPNGGHFGDWFLLSVLGSGVSRHCYG
jgi:hypothetical protein